ncbi:molybdate ABC transporter permease subunit [Thiomicrorhabdus sediminis]|uniref:Molybdenum transport system permease n=1 Tax=Thiomicrorhabdus sediminis TaxID=2580412 RepID=A0A4P9K905_9GAMM|nr:molybdate ABC transporter permease subunit [Thiomicrorhabdus sediminis]QCU90906.1 molybdate ABC transporter permease subunit [Thiomicrorhabdus sediminis]
MLLTDQDFQALWITLQVAFYTTLVLLIIGTPLALWLARISGSKKAVFEALVALPLVLPPTVLGFYLLLAMSPDGAIGSLWSAFGFNALTFSFLGIVIGSVIYSLPFTVQPLMQGFEQLGSRPSEVAATLGAGPVDRFFSVTLPLCRRHYLVAATLTFAHTVGEFGVVLMIGGNIPGVTQVASIAVYDHVEAMEYTQAHGLSLILLLVSLLVLIVVYGLNRRIEKKLA